MEDKKELRSGSLASSSASSINHNDSEPEQPETPVIEPESQTEKDTSRKEEDLPQIEIVPRHLRRGLLSRFAIVPETPKPTLYPNKTKWIITFVVALAAAAAPMGSASIMPTLTSSKSNAPSP